MSWFRNLSLVRQFLMASAPIMLGATLVIGWWVAREIERGVAHRLGEVTSLYVDSLVTPHIKFILDADPNDRSHLAALDALLTDTALGQKIVAFNIWRPDGQIAYSTNPALIGRKFATSPGFATALAGNVSSEIIHRGDDEHGFPIEHWPPKLIETYAPVHEEVLGKIVGVAELYQGSAELDREAASARQRSWMVVIASMLLTYAVLFGLVRRGSQTINAQRKELHDRVTELSGLLSENARLSANVRGAAARTTALNEHFLRRVAADLHDGPAQDLGFAQMRIESMAHGGSDAPPRVDVARADLTAVRSALDSAMADLRSISAGLQLPELDGLTCAEVVSRAVRDYQRKTGASVTLVAAAGNLDAALPVKLTIYRVLQEMLANAFRHGGAVEQRVSVTQADGEIVLEASDRGRPFDVAEVMSRRDGGLANIRERVRALGGQFDLRSSQASGTHLRVRLPARLADESDE